MSEDVQESTVTAAPVELPITAQRHIEQQNLLNVGQDESQSHASYTANLNNGNPTFEVPEEEAKAPEESIWWIDEDTKGSGPKPEFFNDKTFKTVMDQAKAHPELLKNASRPKAGAPETYEYEVEEGFEPSEFQVEAFNNFAEAAKEKNMSQDNFNEVIDGYLSLESARKESESAVLLEQKALLGENADEKIQKMSQWMDTNLPQDIAETFKSSMNNAALFSVAEYFMNKGGYAQMPTSSDMPGSNVAERHLEARSKMKDKRYGNDSEYTRMVDREYQSLAELGAFSNK